MRGNVARGREQLRLALMLAPALSVVVALFGGGLALAVLQSLGYLPFLGRAELTLDAYRTLLLRPDFGHSLLLTLWIAGAATLLSTVLALACALLLRRPLRGQRWLLFGFQANLPIPHLVGALGIGFLVSQSGLLARLAHGVGLIAQPADFPALVYDRWAVGVILEYLWKSTPFIGVILLAALRSIGDEWEAVAQTLGASRWQRFRYVLLPLLRPALLSSSILVLAFTFGAFEVPFLLGQRYPSALPVLAYRRYIDTDLAARPEAMAISVVISLLITGFVLLYMRVARSDT